MGLWCLKLGSSRVGLKHESVVAGIVLRCMGVLWSLKL